MVTGDERVNDEKLEDVNFIRDFALCGGDLTSKKKKNAEGPERH